MTTTITVPFCFLPNTKSQVFDMSSCKRSAFQVNELKRVSEREDFAYFVTTLDVDGEVIMHPDYKSYCHIMWYSKDGQCYSGRVGIKRFLNPEGTWRKVGVSGSPSPLDSVVYACRCG